jgi:hypothetical protein
MSERLKLLAIVAALLFVQVCPAAPQTAAPGKSAASKEDALPSVDQLVEKCAKASGGKEAWLKLQTLVMTGTMEVPSAGLTGTFDRSDERLHQLLTLFQYPLGTPDVENQLVQILADDIRFAPGIRSGRDYLRNVERMLKAMKTNPEFDEEPKEVTYGGQIMHRTDVTMKLPAKVIYQSMIAIVLKGYGISFAFTSFSPEGRDKLVKTLDSLRFEVPQNTPKPH